VRQRGKIKMATPQNECSNTVAFARQSQNNVSCVDGVVGELNGLFFGESKDLSRTICYAVKHGYSDTLSASRRSMISPNQGPFLRYHTTGPELL
jgi:hypothetical protein